VKVLEDNFRKLEAHAAAQGQRPAARGKRVMVHRGDGFQGLKALLPPPSRRGLVLIDPPYEDKRDYSHVAQVLADALTRFRRAPMPCGIRSCSATNRASCPSA
jgi:23S rRNA (adenine2030-N6)-methyltransferase